MPGAEAANWENWAAILGGFPTMKSLHWRPWSWGWWWWWNCWSVFFLCNDTSLLLLVTLVNHQWWWWWQWWVGWLWCFWSQWWWCPPVGPPLHNGYGRHLRLFCLHFLWRTHTHAPQSTDNNTATDNPENSANIISWWTFFLSREVLVKLSLKQSNLPRTSGLKFANKSTWMSDFPDY